MVSERYTLVCHIDAMRLTNIAHVVWMFRSTKVADELNNLSGFSSLLNSSAFDNNQVRGGVCVLAFCDLNGVISVELYIMQHNVRSSARSFVLLTVICAL
jgi:hypothetical protein